MTVEVIQEEFYKLEIHGVDLNGMVIFQIVVLHGEMKIDKILKYKKEMMEYSGFHLKNLLNITKELVF